MNIKNKLIAVSLILSMMAAFTGCSDSGSSSGSSSSTASGNSEAASDAAEMTVATDVTLSSEEIDQISKHELTIEPFVPGGDSGVQQDPVESPTGQSDNSVAANNSTGNSDGNANAQQGDNNNNNSSNDNNNNNNNTSSNNSAGGSGQTAADIGNNNADLPQKTGLQVISGTKQVMQAWWMDLTKQADYEFNGEYLTAQFKIKEGAQNGIYPVTVEWADFSNWEAETIKFTCIDGAVVVGGEAEENKFNDTSDPQIMVSNVSGKVGDTVTVTFNIKNNPGVVGNIFRFGYNSDALEYVGGGEGKDFDGHFQSN